MKTIEIKGTLRSETGKKSSKKIRRDGNVPCVMYGKDKNVHFHAHENSFKNLIYTPDAHLVKIDIEGTGHQAILQDVQFHPVTDRILHVDFMEVVENKPVIIHLPILVTGDSAGVKAGGKLRIKKRTLKVRGFVKYIPEHLEIDITNVKIHQSVKVGELSFSNIELLDPKITTVLSVATSRVVQKGEGEEGVELAAGEETQVPGTEPVEETNN
jgi:large subunit ribosomal protein L25